MMLFNLFKTIVNHSIKFWVYLLVFFQYLRIWWRDLTGENLLDFSFLVSRREKNGGKSVVEEFRSFQNEFYKLANFFHSLLNEFLLHVKERFLMYRSDVNAWIPVELTKSVLIDIAESSRNYYGLIVDFILKFINQMLDFPEHFFLFREKHFHSTWEYENIFLL